MSTYIHTGSVRSRSRRQVSPLELFHGTTVLRSMFHFGGDVCRHGDGHIATPILLRHGQEEWPDRLAAGQPVDVRPDDTRHTHNTCNHTGAHQGGIQWQCSQSTGKYWVKKHVSPAHSFNPFLGVSPNHHVIIPPPPQINDSTGSSRDVIFFLRKCRFLTDLKVKLVILEINADPKLLWFPPFFFLCQSYPCLFNQNVNISHISWHNNLIPWEFVFHKHDLNKLKWGEKNLCMHYFLSIVLSLSY